MTRTLTLSAAALALFAALPVNAKPAAWPRAEAEILALSQETIALRSVRGEGNRTADVARAFKAALAKGGWAEGDIEIVPVDDTAYFVARWQGSDASLKPILVSGHMDVVEAKPADWERDPFTPVVENGYLFGRGASDQKFSAALAVGSLVELRRQGFRPRRTILVVFSGDEETTMKTSKVIAERFPELDLVLNTDGSGGTFDEKDGRPLYFTWDGAEKTYTDYQLEVTNPGGHSSAPRAANAIVQLSAALEKLGTYRFKVEQNDITRSYFAKAAAFESNPQVAAAMRAFAAGVNDAAAVATLRASPAHVGRVSTTCVPTMVSGGHAPNALPQRATATVNCRIFPGHTREEIRAELERVMADPAIKVTDISGDETTISPASPMRPDFVAAVEQATQRAWGKVPVIPSQSSGASDSMWFRGKGIPAYGISPLFIKDTDEYSHGLNERVELRNIRPGVAYYLSLFTDLAK